MLGIVRFFKDKTYTAGGLAGHMSLKFYFLKNKQNIKNRCQFT